MKMLNAANIKNYPTFFKLKSFARIVDLRLMHLAFPAALSLGAAFLEGLGIAILIPLVKGILQMNFDFIRATAPMQFIMHKVLDVQARPQTFIFVFLLLIISITTISSYIMQYFAGIAVSYQVRKMSDRLRRLIFNRYLSFGKLFFDRHNVGYLHNMLTGLTSHITREFLNLQDAINQFFSIIVYLTIMSIISVRLTLIVLLILPILNRVFKRLIAKIKNTSGIYVSSFKKINEGIFNILSCMPLVKVYVQEENEKNNFNILSNNLRRIEFSLDRKRQLIQPLNRIIVFVVILLLISIMSFIVVKEKTVQISSFLIFFFLAKRASNNFNFVNIIKSSLAAIDGPISEIMNIFNDKDKFFVIGGNEEFTRLKSSIEFHNLNFSYVDNIKVLKDISFTIDKGKTTALIGPTGAGKTTLVNLILRFYDCPDSSIFIDGKDIKEFTLESLKKHMAFVSQDALLFNDTLKNNIIYGLNREVATDELMTVVQKARLYDFIVKLPNKFETYIGDRGVKLSGGERQRVAIARALLKNSEILILDEATSSLDSKTEKLIQGAITEAIKGRTTIVIAHRFSTIKNADKIVVIENGIFIEEGTLDGLLDKKGKFFEYWQEQKFY